MKKNVEWIITLAAFTAMAVAAFCCIENYKKNLILNVSYQKSEIRPIVCFGDSLTAGVGGEGINYPYILKQIISVEKKDDGLDKVVIYNEGNSGESSLSIASRSANLKMITTSDVNFKKLSSRQPIYFTTLTGDNIEPWHSSKYKTQVTIDNVKGQLRFDENKYRYYFVRNNILNSQRIPAGSEIIVPQNDRYKEAFTIVFIGQNGGYNSVEDLIMQQKAIIPQEMYNKGLYLILGLTSGSRTERKDLETAMETEYGRNYINLREIMSGKRVNEFASILSESDYKEMQEGIVPQALRAKNDMVHLNSNGYKMIARIIYERMEELQVFDKIIDKGE